jgi:hypothetical protein
VARARLFTQKIAGPGFASPAEVKVLSPGNRNEVLPRFFHRSKREAAEVAAAIRPDEAPPRREVVTTLVRVAAPEAMIQALGAKAPPVADVVDASQRAVQPVEPPHANLPMPPQEGRTIAEPLTAVLRRLHITVSRRFLEKLEAARAALSHVHGGAGAEEVLEAGVDLILARDAKKKAQVERPREESRPSKPEHLPARVKRQVWKRDGGRCQWPLGSGGICGSTLRLEFDHVIPRARGGPSTIENTRLLCRFHNQVAARRVYGDEWMDRFTRERAALGTTGTAQPPA